MDWTWHLFSPDPYIKYILSEIAQWAADNATTLLVITAILMWTQKQAERLEAIKDNKRLTLCGHYLMAVSKFLLGVFSFRWLTQIRPGVRQQALDDSKDDRIADIKAETLSPEDKAKDADEKGKAG